VWRADASLSAWTKVSGITLGSYYGVISCYQNTVIIASYQYLNISTDGGINWTTSTPSVFNKYYLDLLYDGSLYVLCNNASICTSLDGINWTTVVSDIPQNQKLSVCKKNSTYYVCGRNKYLTSTDGVNWTTNDIGTGVNGNVMSDVLWDGTKYVANGVISGPIWSLDGKNWSLSTTSDGSFITSFDYVKFCLHYGGSAYTFRSQSQNKLYSSIDGKVWKALIHPTSGKFFLDSYPQVTDPNRNKK
jgi:archaellum component FlaF (FlaF/FlaG flagellin family)